MWSVHSSLLPNFPTALSLSYWSVGVLYSRFKSFVKIYILWISSHTLWMAFSFPWSCLILTFVFLIEYICHLFHLWLALFVSYLRNLCLLQGHKDVLLFSLLFTFWSRNTKNSWVPEQVLNFNTFHISMLFAYAVPFTILPYPPLKILTIPQACLKR